MTKKNSWYVKDLEDTNEMLRERLERSESELERVNCLFNGYERTGIITRYYVEMDFDLENAPNSYRKMVLDFKFYDMFEIRDFLSSAYRYICNGRVPSDIFIGRNRIVDTDKPSTSVRKCIRIDMRKGEIRGFGVYQFPNYDVSKADELLDIVREYIDKRILRGSGVICAK